MLGGCRLEVCDEVSSFTLLFDAGEDHLCSRNIFLGIFQINHERVLIPNDTFNKKKCYSKVTESQIQPLSLVLKKNATTFAFVGVSIREALRLSSFASKQAPKVRPNLVLSTLINSVALGTLLDKRLLAFLYICRHCTWGKK